MHINDTKNDAGYQQQKEKPKRRPDRAQKQHKENRDGRADKKVLAHETAFESNPDAIVTQAEEKSAAGLPLLGRFSIGRHWSVVMV